MKYIFLPEAGLFLLLFTFLPGPARPPAGTIRVTPLQRVYASDRQIGTLTVSPDGRLFFNYARWFGPVPVAELKNGQPVAFPNLGGSQAAVPVSRRFLSVQRVKADADGPFRWIVDAANP